MLPFCSDVWDRTSPPRDDVGVTAHTQGGSTPRHDCALRPFTEESRGSNGRIPCLWPEVRNCVKSLRFNYTRSLSPDMFFLVRGLQITAASRSQDQRVCAGGGSARVGLATTVPVAQTVSQAIFFGSIYPTRKRLSASSQTAQKVFLKSEGCCRLSDGYTLIMIILSRFCRLH